MSRRGVRVDDAAWRDLKLRVKNARGMRVKVGVLASRGGSAPHTADSAITMVELMAIHEYGSPAAGIPERRPIRTTFDEKASEIAALQAKLAAAFVEGKLTIEQALGLLGTKAVAMVKFTIAGGPHLPPPLQPATVARKGSDRPLVDTGRLVNSIAYEVTREGDEG